MGVQAAFSAFLAIQNRYIRHNGDTHGGLRIKADAQADGIRHVDGFQLRQQFVAVAEEKADEVGGGNKGGEGWCDVIHAVLLPRVFPEFDGEYQEKERHDDFHFIAGHGFVAQMHPRQQGAECAA